MLAPRVMSRTTESLILEGAASPSARAALLDPHNHRIGSGEVLNKGLPEPRLLHPPLAVRARIVEASWRLYEHVQAHEQPEGILRPVVVDDGFVDDQGAALGQRVMGFFEERQLLLDVPVVQ